MSNLDSVTYKGVVYIFRRNPDESDPPHILSERVWEAARILHSGQVTNPDEAITIASIKVYGREHGCTWDC
jgi:hypothetical protein